jgi:hypothetical protein
MMNRRGVFTLSTITVLGLALLPGSLGAQQGTLRQQLAGSWTLVSVNSTPASTFGANLKGILILEAGGRYAELFERPDRPKYKNPSQPTTEERAAAQAFAANFGTWSVNEGDKTLTQRFEGALNPNNEGMDVKSSVNLAGDELRLARVLPSTGSEQDFVYRRAR